jgi:hypothetical protein
MMQIPQSLQVWLKAPPPSGSPTVPSDHPADHP